MSANYGQILAELLLIADRPPENLTLQLSQVDSVIARLSEWSRDLRERINATNPFLSLPTEIISEISMLACQPVYDADDPDNFATSTQLTSPLTFGKVCRTWRHIAWASPRLWSVIFFGLRPMEPEIYKGQQELLEAWLSRSGDLLLSVYLYQLVNDPEGWSESPPTEVFNLLASYSHRWLHLSTFLIGPCWENLQELPVPFLTSFAVEPPGNNPDYETTWKISDAPRLRNVYIVAFTQEQVKLPMHQLTQITWESLHWQSCLLLLADTPNVVQCALLKVRASIDDTDYQPVISLPHMSIFTVESSYTYDQLNRILNCITAPALRQMQLKWYGLPGSEPFATIRAFLSRSSCSLRQLSLNMGQCLEQNEESLIALLADTEGLEKLELICHGEGMLDPVLNHLNPARPQDIPQYWPAARILLPNLRCFWYQGPLRFKIKTLVDMIDMRYRMAYDGEKVLELGCGENHSRLVRPETFNIDILGVNLDEDNSLSVSAGTLQALVKEHGGITFSFLDQAGNNVSLLD